MEAVPTKPDAAVGPRAAALASLVAIGFYAIAGFSEAALIRVFALSAVDFGWISDTVLSVALGVVVYLWLHLRAARLALSERERAELVLDTQLSVAENMQRRLLPDIPEAADGVQWAAILAPAWKIGGDFYDFVEPLPGVRLALVADVSGKGIPAAMALTLLRSTFRNLARDTQDPSHLASLMSNALYGEWHGSPYVTCMIARLDAKSPRLTYVNAGHPPGILVHRGKGRDLTAGGPPLGLLENARYAEERVELASGDVCAFMTDGVTEALEASRPDWHALAAEAVRDARGSAAAVCDAIMARSQEGAGPHGVDGWTDDRTVVVLAVADQAALQDAPAQNLAPEPAF
jgi:serine phosphatase RsbU (regulator of sigma subunit)